MNEVNKLILPLVLTCIVSFFYKVYLQDTLNGDKSSVALIKLARRIFSIKYVLPLRHENYPKGKMPVVKRANKALAIFWTSFALIITLGIITETYATTTSNLFRRNYKVIPADIEYIRSKQWSYDGGFKVGQGDFLIFTDTTLFQIKNDTIFYRDTPKAKVIGLDKKYYQLHIKSIPDGKQGEYRNVDGSLN